MAPSTTIRQFRWEDLDEFTSLFNEVNGMTNTEVADDVEYMRQFLSQPSCQPETDCYLAESRGSLVGFALLAPELPIGRAVASGGVKSSHRNLGIGRTLLKACIKHVEAIEVSELHIQVLSDGMAAAHLLLSEGFQVVKDYWVMRWQGHEFPPLELPDGFSIRPFRLDQDEAALTDLQNAAFGEHWGFCPNTVEEISARVRMKRCHPEGIIFVVEGGRPSGYNWTLSTSTEAGSIGWISMTGVHPDYRGRGLGTAVVMAGLEYLNGRNVPQIELEVDSENIPARQLYLKLGFWKVQNRIWYEKRLGG